MFKLPSRNVEPMTMKYAIMTILAVTIATVNASPIFAAHDLDEDHPFTSGAGGGVLNQSVLMLLQ